jgi:hypothetical protein
MRSGETPVFGIYPVPTVQTGNRAAANKIQGSLRSVEMTLQCWCYYEMTASKAGALGRDDTSKTGARYYETTLQKLVRSVDDTSKAGAPLAGAGFRSPP